MKQVDVDCDICGNCGEHADWEENEDGETVSNCCGAGGINSDVDLDMER